MSLIAGGYIYLEREVVFRELVSGLSAFVGPVEHNPDGSMTILGGDEVSIAFLRVALKPNTEYRLSARVTGSATVHVDLYGDKGAYDSAEKEMIIPAGTQALEYVHRFSSGDCPDDVVLRIFFRDKGPVSVESISLLQVNSSALPSRRLAAALTLLLLSSFAYPYRKWLIVQALYLFGVVVIAYFLVPIPETQNVGDNVLYVPSSQSLLREGNFDLNEYSAWFQSDPDVFNRKTVKVFGHTYSLFPVGTSLVVLPLVFLGDILLPGDVLSTNKALQIAADSAKIMAAVSVSLIFLLACKLTGGKRLVSLALALLFGFGTSHFSAHAGGLWSHNTAVLAFTGALYLMTIRDGRYVWLSSLPLALGYLSRPDFSIVVVVMSLYVLLHHRQAFLSFAALGLSVFAWFSAWSYSVYGQWLPPYYLAGRLGSPTFWEARAGNVASPNRGLFIFTPIALFSVYGGYLAFREPRTTPPLYRYLFAASCVHWIAISSFPHWWAGYSYGPRFFCSVLPALILLLVPVHEKWQSMHNQRRRVAVAVLFAILALTSLFVQTTGAIWMDGQMWNATPVNVDEHPERIWDWRDWQPARILFRY